MQEVVYKQAIETALVSLKKNGIKTYLENYNQFNQSLAALTGFRELSTFQNIDNPLEILDVVNWEGLEAATAADEAVQSKEEFKPTFLPMDKVEHFEHSFIHHQIELCDLDEDTVLEFYVYKLKTDDLQGHLELKKEFMQMLQDQVAGFQRYVSMQSVKDEAVQIDLYFFKKTNDTKDENVRIEASSISKRFEASMDSLSIYKTFQPLKLERTKLDLAKTDKAYYSAKKTAEIVDVDSHLFLSISGKSAPESEVFMNSIPAIYTLAYTVKNHYQALGNDFVVPKMEAQWWVEGEKPFDQASRDEWCWKIKIRMPQFVDEKIMQKNLAEANKMEIVDRTNEVKFETEPKGKAAQILHIGSYENEQASIGAIMALIKKEGFTIRDHHKEIYLTDPRKTEESKLRTIIRYGVE